MGITFQEDVSSVKIFEYVAGASLRGKTIPGTKVTAQVRILTNQGRTYIWQTASYSGSDGIFAISVPYSTDYSGTVHALSPYTVTTGSGQYITHVTNEAVTLGEILTIK